MKLITIIAAVFTIVEPIRVPVWPTKPKQPTVNINEHSPFGIDEPFITYPHLERQLGVQLNTYIKPKYDHNGFAVDGSYSAIIHPQTVTHSNYNTHTSSKKITKGWTPVVPLIKPVKVKVVPKKVHYHVHPVKKVRYHKKPPAKIVVHHHHHHPKPHSSYQKPIHIIKTPPLPNPFAVNQPIYYNRFFKPVSFDQIQQQKQTDNSEEQIYQAYKEAVLQKNYRDDTTHESLDLLEIDPFDEEKEDIIREEHEKAPISDHEYPLDIPTKPLYPGPGQWAKKGIKHKPFISQQKYSKLAEDDERPDGYDTFEAGQALFEKQKSKYANNLESTFPSKSSNNHASYSNQGNKEEFVPTKLYAQVRRTEEEKHLPHDPDEPRLREVIKDSKVQTVYSEEGYEDSAYDHAGHEKHAEEGEGNNNFLHKQAAKKGKEYYYEDSEGEGSDYNEAKQDLSTDESHYPYNEGPNEVKKPIKTNRFTKMKEVKTTEVKDLGNGDMAYQISSEVKIITNPDNKTTSHKYVKIYPKKVISTKGEEKTEDYEEVEETTTPIPTEVAEVNTDDEVTPLTTQETLVTLAPGVPIVIDLEDVVPVETYDPAYTEILKVGVTPSTTTTTSDLPVTDNTAMESNSKVSRIKRDVEFVNDFPRLEVDTDFIDHLRTDPPRSRPKEDFTHIKYPYYQLETIHKNSPLRYAENYNNIPKKRPGDMAFYRQADLRTRCEEVQSDVDPIPDRVKNAEHEDATDVAEIGDTQRLRGLGDKIDCFKIKFFGEDPLDSPIFKEEYIEPPEPIFFEMKPKSVFQINDAKYEDLVKLNEIKESYEAAPTVKGNTVVDASGSNLVEKARLEKQEVKDTATEVEVASTISPTSLPQISIITTPKYTVQLTPKHIYDQIHLLNYLPAFNISRIEVQNVSTTQETEVAPSKTSLQVDERPHPKSINDQLPDDVEEIRPETLKVQVNNRRPKSRKEERKPQKSTAASDYSGLEISAWQKRPINLQIFDINQYLPTLLPTQFPQPDQKADRSISEVHYKEDIKPNEQLNVFEDVINNIRSNPPEATQSTELSKATVFRPKIYRPKHRRRKGPKRKNRIRNPIIDLFSAGAEPQNSRAKLGEVHYQPVQQVYNTPVTVSPTKSSTNHVSEEPTAHTSLDYIEEPFTEVLGLVPPGKWKYKTIYSPKRPAPIYAVVDNAHINLYPVVGMKPPPSTQNLLSYAEYKLLHASNIVKRRAGTHHRGRRSAGSYSEIKRSGAKEEEEEEDVTPHRSKNYHYDVKTGRIVYDNVTPKTEELDIVEEVQQEEVTTTSTTTKPKTNTEMNWFQYVQLLKSHKDYQHIPEPEITEKSETTTEELKVTTPKGPTTTPEYLNILALIKKDSSYVKIPDKDEKTTTTTESQYIEVEVEPEESIELKNIQNSPGGQTVTISDGIKIFDVNEFIPKRNYNPRTVVDTSKYKSIERSTKRNTEAIADMSDSDVAATSVEDIEVTPAIVSEEPTTEAETTSTTTTTTTEVPSTTEARNTRIVKRIRSRKGQGVTSTTENSVTRTMRRSSLYARTTTPKPDTTPKPTMPKPSKPLLRRQLRARTTTEKFIDEEPTEATNKNLQRRHQPSKNIPKNHKEIYVDEDELGVLETSTANSNGTEEETVKPTPRTITDDIISHVVNKSIEAGLKRHEIRARKIADVEIINRFNKNQRHGGNYRRRLPGQTRIKETLEDVDLITKYDEIQKTGGNLRKTPDDEDIEDTETASDRKEEVRLFKKFDKSRKHGGNYKKDKEAIEEVKIEEKIEETATIPKDVEVIAKFDENKKHGGNYRKIDDQTSKPSVGNPVRANRNRVRPPSKDRGKISDVEVFANYDKNQKTGGNYRKEGDRRKTIQKPTKTIVQNKKAEVTKLVDVVEKPDSFYSDPKLPTDVNQLKEPDSKIKIDKLFELEILDKNEPEVVDDKESGESVEDFVDKAEERIDVVETAESKYKPFFIKDPHKRKYIFAPV